jgi:DNA mismatch repair protein MutS
MVETAQILQKATNNSLVIMDEIGRGTSTYDGISISWAIAEYLVSSKNIKPKTLFATHYHELQELEKHHKNIQNFHMAIEDENNKPVFLYTLVPGGTSHSYGIAVAHLAGIPDNVIDSAYRIMHGLEKRENQYVNTNNSKQTSYNLEFTSELQKLDINNITPMQALELLATLKKKYEKNT